MKLHTLFLSLLSIFMISSHPGPEEFFFTLGCAGNKGVGIFAAQDIPAGTELPFPDNTNFRLLTAEEIHPAFLKYCVAHENGKYICPQAFNRMEIGWYLNHSDSPNITLGQPGICLALRDIKAGEEILINYNEFDEPEESKEAFYTI